jgi:F0F1-type ATP synthase assembly protein I
LLAKFFTSAYVPDRIMPDDERNRVGRSFGEGYSYVALGFSFAFAILVFGALGWIVDGWFGTRPLFALVGAGVGGFGGFMSIYYRVQRDSAKRDGGSGKRKA